MPPLFIIIFAALVGWPLVKLAATLVSRRKWEGQKRLKSELERDQKYGELERRIVHEKFQEGKGSLLQLALPFVVFFGGIAAAFAFSGRDRSRQGEALGPDLLSMKEQLFRIDYPQATSRTFLLLHDRRFDELSNRAFELEMLRYPIATIVTGFAIIPSLVLIVCLSGIRVSLNGVARRVIESSRQTVKTFSTLMFRPEASS